MPSLSFFLPTSLSMSSCNEGLHCGAWLAVHAVPSRQTCRWAPIRTALELLVLHLLLLKILRAFRHTTSYAEREKNHQAPYVPSFGNDATGGCLDGDILMSLVGCAAINSLVHVIMYIYYFCSAIGVRVPLKKWVTRIQIAQFFFGMIGGTYFFVLYLKDPSVRFGFDASPIGIALDYTQGCAGDATPLIWTFLMNVSFLILFSLFFRNTYSSRSSNKAAVKRD